MNDTTQAVRDKTITMSAERYERATMSLFMALGTLGLVCQELNGRSDAERALEAARHLVREADEALCYWKDRPGYVESEETDEKPDA